MTDFADSLVVATKVVTQKVANSIALGELVLLVLTEPYLKIITLSTLRGKKIHSPLARVRWKNKTDGHHLSVSALAG